MSNQFQIADNLADKYADLILQAIDLHPDYLPDDHGLFKYPFNEWRLGKIFERGNINYSCNKQHIIDRFREKADAIVNGNLFCVNSDLKTEKQYIELWDKILYGLEKTHKELNTILTEVGLKPFYYYLTSTVKHTLDAVVFLHEVKKYIHLGDHGAPNPIPKINLMRGGKGTHIQYAKAEMKDLWSKYKEKNYPPLESKLSPAKAGKEAGRKTTKTETLRLTKSRSLAFWNKQSLPTIKGKRFDILLELAKRPGEVVLHDDLYKLIDSDTHKDELLRQYITKIRSAFPKPYNDPEKGIIISRKWEGYLLNLAKNQVQIV